MVQHRLTFPPRLARHLLTPRLLPRQLHRLLLPLFLPYLAIRVGQSLLSFSQPPIRLRLPDLPLDRGRNRPYPPGRRPQPFAGNVASFVEVGEIELRERPRAGTDTFGVYGEMG
ncbi:hypothetical protein L1049_006912 [Liquidambar formosana]|uniref:Uncharacterized protein n=1 Tax=Liquidambar formosana TaxID=63359 RepID=A0AAP0RI09_LIQFO